MTNYSDAKYGMISGGSLIKTGFVEGGSTTTNETTLQNCFNSQFSSYLIVGENISVSPQSAFSDAKARFLHSGTTEITSYDAHFQRLLSSSGNSGSTGQNGYYQLNEVIMHDTQIPETTFDRPFGFRMFLNLGDHTNTFSSYYGHFSGGAGGTNTAWISGRFSGIINGSDQPDGFRLRTNDSANRFASNTKITVYGMQE
jgi:hypothetical protein